MNKLNVLLVCGSGASSGFMAANIRKAAARKLEITVNARSESEIEYYIDEIDCLKNECQEERNVCTFK